MNIGSKVVPITKSIGFGLNSCREWTIGKEQGYLYIVGIHDEGYVLSAFKHTSNGSLYRFDDVMPFNDKDDKYFNQIKEGVYIKDLEIGVEWNKNGQFLNALEKDEDLLCISCFDKNFVHTLNLAQMKKMHRYLGEVLDYCNANKSII